MNSIPAPSATFETGPGPLYRPAILDLPPSPLTEVVRQGEGRTDIIRLWHGETDIVTPAFIRDAAAEAITAGQTFYSNARGVLPLRQALAHYLHRHYGVDLEIDRITVPGSAMLAINMVLQCLVGEGDRLVVVTPQWANITLAAQSRGAEIVRVAQKIEGEGTAARWALDMDELVDACVPGTKALFVGSPANPTGYRMGAEDQKRLLAVARERGIAIISDEVYGRLIYDGDIAPSFLPLITPEDRVFVINSFSKIWAMTGWRVGWLVGPTDIGEKLLCLSGVNNTGAPPFIQHGAIAALEQGEDLVALIRQRCAEGLALVEAHLGANARLRMARPEGAFYAFIEIDGVTDSVDFASRLLAAERVGVAPGAAFGPGNDNRIRICFAQDPARLAEALERFNRFLAHA